MADRFTLSQLKELWVKAGGNPKYADMAAAIAMAESGGNPASVNDKNPKGTIDRGLWQINSIHGKQSTTDVDANARAAVAISKNGTDWRPWCTAWSNGRCGGTFMGSGAPVLKYLPAGQTQSGTVVTGLTGTPTVTGIPLPGGEWMAGIIKGLSGFFGLNPLDDVVTNFVTALRRYVFYWFMLFVGIAMMVFGIILLVLSTRTAKNIIGARLAGNGGTIVVQPQPNHFQIFPPAQPAPTPPQPLFPIGRGSRESLSAAEDTNRRRMQEMAGDKGKRPLRRKSNTDGDYQPKHAR